MSERRLQFNPEPLKVVAAAVRDVWTRDPYVPRCYHEDGRGQCAADGTNVRYGDDGGRYCDRHVPEGWKP